MTRSLLANVGVVALSVMLLGGAVQLQAVRDRTYPPRADTQEDAIYLRSGTTVRRFAGAFTAVAADVYWVRTIQYYGGTKRRLDAESHGVTSSTPSDASRANEYALMYPLLDITTTLDPRFNIAYRFGAVFLAEAFPRGPDRPDLAIALLEKGLRATPDKWEYMEDIGFVHYWYEHDYRAAAASFEQAASVPGAPWWLRSLAATTLAQGGDRRSSRVMWEAIRQSSEIDWLRQDAERRLAQLHALDDIDALQKALDAFIARAGRPPEDWAALVRARVLRGVPLDPSRTAYTLSPEGRVGLSAASTLWPLPEEPQRTGTRP